jgi:hypothetical protein
VSGDAAHDAAHDAAGDGYDSSMAEAYWQRVHLPMLQRLGFPGEALYDSRRRYLDAVERSAEAREQLVTWARTGYDPGRVPR